MHKAESIAVFFVYIFLLAGAGIEATFENGGRIPQIRQIPGSCAGHAASVLRRSACRRLPLRAEFHHRVAATQSKRAREMLRKTSLMLLGAAAGVSATLLVSNPHLLLDGARAQAAVRDTYSALMLFGDVFERVRDDFIEKPDDRMLIESAISGMLGGLDPHSSYMDPQSYRDMQIDTSGEFGGLGLEVTMENGLVKVIAPDR
jgi:hypothetical protein